MFKIRKRETGEFFTPRKGWNQHGKFYKTMSHAKKAFKYIMERFELNRAELEVVEYEIVEKK